jgi:hypothetical protein
MMGDNEQANCKERKKAQKSNADATINNDAHDR